MFIKMYECDQAKGVYSGKTSVLFKDREMGCV